jgi:hypothetical protein
MDHLEFLRVFAAVSTRGSRGGLWPVLLVGKFIKKTCDINRLMMMIIILNSDYDSASLSSNLDTRAVPHNLILLMFIQTKIERDGERLERPIFSSGL